MDLSYPVGMNPGGYYGQDQAYENARLTRVYKAMTALQVIAFVGTVIGGFGGAYALQNGGIGGGIFLMCIAMMGMMSLVAYFVVKALH